MATSILVMVPSPAHHDAGRGQDPTGTGRAASPGRAKRMTPARSVAPWPAFARHRPVRGRCRCDAGIRHALTTWFWIRVTGVHHGGASGAAARYVAAMSVRVERVGAVTTVILDRPAVKNAVDRATAEALADAFRAFDADDQARVGVLWGDHGTFSAGADLKAMAAGAANRVAADGDGPMGPSRRVLGKPVIAAIAGHAVAGGLELALWCDLRVVEDDAILGVFCRRWGVPLIDGGTIRLPRLIGLSRALDLILTGRPVTAAEALAMGLANRVVPPGSARMAAETLAAALARLPQAALRGDRLSAYEQHDLPLDAALGNELRHGMAALADAAAGIDRFVAGAGRHGDGS
jgi:enoyl-CoA hydratase